MSSGHATEADRSKAKLTLAAILDDIRGAQLEFQAGASLFGSNTHVADVQKALERLTETIGELL